MQYKLKQLYIGLLVLGLSSPTFAECCSHSHSPAGGFSASLDALYLRPNNNQMNYAAFGHNAFISIPGGTGITNVQNEQAVEPAYHWGFHAEVGYWFPCTFYDLTLGYAQLNTDDTSSIDVGPDNDGGAAINGPFVNLIPLSQLITGTANPAFRSADSKASFDMKVSDLDMGRHFTGNGYDLRLLGGLRYAKIDRDMETVGFPGNTSSVRTPAIQNLSSHFKGFGPHFGAQGRYELCGGFGVDADVNAAFLIGQVDSAFQGKASYSIVSSSPDTGVIDYSSSHSQDRNVPVLEGKLGVDYTYVFNACSQSALVLEAGYQVNHYYNVVEEQSINYFPFFVVSGPSLAFNQQATIPGDSSDVSFNGPYLSLKYYA